VLARTREVQAPSGTRMKRDRRRPQRAPAITPTPAQRVIATAHEQPRSHERSGPTLLLAPSTGRLAWPDAGGVRVRSELNAVRTVGEPAKPDCVKGSSDQRSCSRCRAAAPAPSHELRERPTFVVAQASLIRGWQSRLTRKQALADDRIRRLGTPRARDRIGDVPVVTLGAERSSTWSF
jgi:hypothetical protein